MLVLLIDSNFPLLVICGPTAVGKSACAIEAAKRFGGEIVSADSRQFYKDLNIGTAKPTKKERAEIRHHFIDFLELSEDYSAGRFEQEALECIDSIHDRGKLPILVGGSGMYIRAVVEGLDALPTDPKLRNEIQDFYHKNGIRALQIRLKNIDADYFKKIDQKNFMRLIRAIEVSELTGEKHINLLSNTPKKRHFYPLYIGLQRERKELYDTINKRVDWMLEIGLLAEAKSAIAFKQSQALQTVGYRELFAYLEGIHNLEKAVELIKRNSRRYAKRQLTWLRKNEAINWFQYNDYDTINAFIKTKIKTE